MQVRYFKPTFGNRVHTKLLTIMKSRVLNFTKFKHLFVKRSVFPRRNINKYACMFPEAKKCNHIDHILIFRRRYLIMLAVLCFTGADYDIDHNLLLAKVRQRLAVSNMSPKKKAIDRYNHKEK